MTFVSCPKCNLPVDPQARYCEHCGVDLGYAAVVAERDFIFPPPLPEGVPLAPEVLVPRLGDYLIEKGVLQAADLERALHYQKEKSGEGEQLLVGQALLELGLVDRETLDQVITSQILQLQTALSVTNRKLEQRVQERTRDLQAALERLAELNQLKSNFIANISHELRTPLTHLKGYLDILASEGLGPVTPDQKEAFIVLLKAENRLEQLIEDLIQFSLASKGELSIQPVPSDLGRLIRMVVERVQHKAELLKIDLSYSLSDPLPKVLADEEKIAWVIGQLLDNALKFTPAGGRVRLRTVVDDHVVWVAVMDSGVGIPEDRLGEIFDAFHQLDSSATRRYGGTGLGLAMVKQIIEAHNATISVHSVVGLGSRFEFPLMIVEHPNTESRHTEDTDVL